MQYVKPWKLQSAALMHSPNKIEWLVIKVSTGVKSHCDHYVYDQNASNWIRKTNKLSESDYIENNEDSDYNKHL